MLLGELLDLLQGFVPIDALDVLDSLLGFLLEIDETQSCCSLGLLLLRLLLGTFNLLLRLLLGTFNLLMLLLVAILLG